jgi:ankyrin repeat protein
LNNYEAAVRPLLDSKADIEAKNNYSSTALHLAAWSGHEVTVRLLVDRKADIEANDNGGRTALHFASLNGHEATVWLLLNCKADIKAMDNNGSTALHLAALRGHKATVQLLIDHTASIEAKNNYGSTAHHLAAFYGHKATVRLLLNRKGLEAQKNSGSTVLNVHNDMESMAAIFELPVPDESIKLPFHDVPLISVAQELVVKLFSYHLDSIQLTKFTQLRDMLAGNAPDYPVKLVCGPEKTAAYHIGVEHGKYKLLDTANEPIGYSPCSADPAVFVYNLMYLVRYKIFQNLKNSTVAANLDGKFKLELDIPCKDLKASLDIILLYSLLFTNASLS